MAYFVFVGGKGTWLLIKVASHIDPPNSRWVSFSLKDTRERHRHKNLYMLTWHIDERRVADSSEWRELRRRQPRMADWCRAEIEKHMTEN